MSRLQRVVIMSDNHGDMADAPTLDAIEDFCTQFKPDHRIHLGDCFDLRALRNGADAQDKADGITADVEAGLSWLERYRPDVFMVGNHDFRLWDKAASRTDGVLRDACNLLIRDVEDATKGVVVKPYDKRDGVHEWGDMRFIHGSFSNLHTAYKLASHYGKATMGHIHSSTGPVRFPHIQGAVGYTCGASCRLSMGYNRTHVGTLRQNNGFMYGFRRRKFVQLFHVEPADGHWIYPTEFKDAA